MLMDLYYAGKHVYKCYVVRRDPRDDCGRRVSAGRCAVASAVEPGHGRSSFETHQ
jgi:hypothetical protein